MNALTNYQHGHKDQTATYLQYIKDVREPASLYYAGSHRTGHRLAMGSKMAVCLHVYVAMEL